LLRFIPAPDTCTNDEISKAFKFLCDEWLVDVATDLLGKCVLIAYALTIIERSLFPERPHFFVTAGSAAAAWSSDEEERRKAILAYLLDGVPTVVWDNIPLGTKISSQVLEKITTMEFYEDRLLGVTKRVSAPTYTVQAFTGNNIAAKGDLSSRCLIARLVVEQARPENRSFAHPYPIDWTLAHRGEILRVLYTILLGNPQLAPDCQRDPPTRFKASWRLAGSAIEHAASLKNQAVFSTICSLTPRPKTTKPATSSIFSSPFMENGTTAKSSRPLTSWPT
jgi:hypothetical protein